jgi:hypothetical protein
VCWLDNVSAGDTADAVTNTRLHEQGRRREPAEQMAWAPLPGGRPKHNKTSLPKRGWSWGQGWTGPLRSGGGLPTAHRPDASGAV